MCNDEKNGLEDLVKSENIEAFFVFITVFFPLIEKKSGGKREFILLFWAYNPFA